MKAYQIMEIGVLVLIGESFHTRHICRKEDQAKIAGTYLILELSGIMKEEVILKTINATVGLCIKEVLDIKNRLSSGNQGEVKRLRLFYFVSRYRKFRTITV
jgi:hypothetical protein